MRILYWSLGEFYVAYPKSEFPRKNESWNNLVQNPPPFLGLAPGVSRDNNPYRASHIDKAWRWKVKDVSNPGAHSVFVDDYGHQLSPLNSAQRAAQLVSP